MKIRSGFLELLHADIQKAYFTKLTREFLQNLDTNALKMVTTIYRKCTVKFSFSKGMFNPS